MAFAVLLMWAALFLPGLKRAALYRSVGQARYANKCFKRLCAVLCGLTYLFMLTQVFLAYLSGASLIHTVLPLHICGLTGLLTAFMLFSKNSLLRAFYVYLGMPGALLALIFPSVMTSDYQPLMDLAFYSVHALIVLAGVFSFFHFGPLRPRDAATVFLLGVLFMAVVYLLNQALNTNYMFLRAAPKNTPLAFLFSKGEYWYLASLVLLGAATLTLEGLAARFYLRRKG